MCLLHTTEIWPKMQGTDWSFKMKHIVYDCDNTFGVKNCDVDDGLALIYLLGCEDAVIHGITTAYGNSDIRTVNEATRKLLKELNREDIPIKTGGDTPDDTDTEAADCLAEAARMYKGELSVLATGSLTNLKGAYLKDTEFFGNVKEIVLMGGITEPLKFSRRIMDELNFSCDPEAARLVLEHGRNVSVITGNNCLKAVFTYEEYMEELSGDSGSIAEFIRTKTAYYYDYHKDVYGIDGVYNWDVTAAAYLMRPELFADNPIMLDFSKSRLEKGMLVMGDKGADCNLPAIRDEKAFKRNIFDIWMNVSL